MTEELNEVAAPESAQRIEGGDQAGIWINLLQSVLISIVIAALGLWAYHHWIISPHKQHVAMLDIAEVLQLKELEMTVMMSRPGISDAERAQGYEAIKSFAGNIEEAVATLQRECECLILVRNAVVRAPAAEDLTPRLKAMLEMEHVTKDALITQLRNAGGTGWTLGTPDNQPKEATK